MRTQQAAAGRHQKRLDTEVPPVLALILLFVVTLVARLGSGEASQGLWRTPSAMEMGRRQRQG